MSYQPIFMAISDNIGNAGQTHSCRGRVTSVTAEIMTDIGNFLTLFAEVDTREIHGPKGGYKGGETDRVIAQIRLANPDRCKVTMTGGTITISMQPEGYITADTPGITPKKEASIPTE